jgi:hypothetical protein
MAGNVAGITSADPNVNAIVVLGNATAGVFDMKLRKGNNQRREYSFQARYPGN